ncbi:acetyltransferase [Bhargavaea cecembensis]|uniref:Acetyltransferase n=1 Tax=Bhargavaea cecembensis TaxID=394098 RepID=A0A165GPR7_9BACL|nr:GNAT family N-acetyltransferase [Bhargavaea cecembensis]KZE37214.1 acetyltransferase [Bhargavaea cecembensis]
MITELKRAEFKKCRGLLNKQGQLEAQAIVEGVNPGRIFVDDVESPASGLIWLGNNDGFLFIGDEKNEGFNAEIHHFIDTVIKPEAEKVGLAWFEGVGNHPKWDQTIEKVFESRKLGTWNQKVYTLHKDDFISGLEHPLEEGYKIEKIDRPLYNNRNQSISNIGFLHSKILEFWPSPEAFLNTGIGYCAVYKSQVVSVCFSGFVVDHVHCVDIETLKEHQGKKLAQHAALAFAEDCLERGLLPYWDCMESNTPSVAVAEKLGFRNAFDYKGYEFMFE